MARVLIAVLTFLILASARSEEPIRSHHAVKTLEIYRHIIQVDTSKTKGSTIGIASYLAEAEYALNSDAGGGELEARGNPKIYRMPDPE